MVRSPLTPRPRRSGAFLRGATDLLDRGIATQAEFDEAQTAVESPCAGSTRRRPIAVAGSPCPEEIKAAENQVKQAGTAIEQAKWRLSKRSLAAPSAGRVDDIIRNPGDVAGPSAPVISMLPDGAVKLSVFVPEASFSSVAVGEMLKVRCDGCPDGIEARISYVSPDPEFTPPVIYSLETRQKLVYLVEARPVGDATPLQPGQIVDVVLGEGIANSAGHERALSLLHYSLFAIRSVATAAPNERHRRQEPGEALRRQDRRRSCHLTVAEGEIVGFLGPNGSGKTTTIRIMCGLLTPDEGEGEVLGYDLRTESLKIKREVGYMTQKFSFYEDLTIAENLEFVARLYQLKPVSEHVDRTLEDLGLATRRGQLAGTLSGGLEAAPRARRLHPCTSRSCSCSTSPPPASTRRPGASSGTRSIVSRTTA